MNDFDFLFLGHIDQPRHQSFMDFIIRIPPKISLHQNPLIIKNQPDPLWRAPILLNLPSKLQLFLLLFQSGPVNLQVPSLILWFDLYNVILSYLTIIQSHLLSCINDELVGLFWTFNVPYHFYCFIVLIQVSAHFHCVY